METLKELMGNTHGNAGINQCFQSTESSGVSLNVYSTDNGFTVNCCGNPLLSELEASDKILKINFGPVFNTKLTKEQREFFTRELFLTNQQFQNIILSGNLTKWQWENIISIVYHMSNNERERIKYASHSLPSDKDLASGNYIYSPSSINDIQLRNSIALINEGHPVILTNHDVHPTNFSNPIIGVIEHTGDTDLLTVETTSPNNARRLIKNYYYNN